MDDLDGLWSLYFLRQKRAGNKYELVLQVVKIWRRNLNRLFIMADIHERRYSRKSGILTTYYKTGTLQKAARKER